MSDRVFRDSRELNPSPASTLVAIGNFDGVHLGHRSVLLAAVNSAKRLGLRPLVLTFDPHPVEVLRGQKLERLTPTKRKLELMLGLEASLEVLVQPFLRALADCSPEDFARDFLRDQLGAGAVVVGRNFRFGQGRTGDLSTLETLGESLGFQAWAEDLKSDEGGIISSTRIRQALKRGDVVTAESWLGRPHSIEGTVIRGDQLGRTLGFPTANLEPDATMLPLDGVYAAEAQIYKRGQFEDAGICVVHVGERPTLSAPEHRVEAHLLDDPGDVYGCKMRISFRHRLRSEQKFAGIDELKAAISNDIAHCREWFRALTKP